MIREKLAYYTDRLQQENYKSFYLAFLRVAISCWLLKELSLNWSSMDILYEKGVFEEFTTSIVNRIPGGFATLRAHYMWVIVPYIVTILLNILGIGRWVTALLLLLLVHIWQQMNGAFFNGGDKMARLILIYLVFANSYQYFVLVKQKSIDSGKRNIQNLLSNLAAVSIMLQLCVAYFSSGIAKLFDPFWIQGQGTYYALLMERFRGTSFNTYLAQQRWIDLLSNYGTILFELLFPALIWIQKFRKPLLIAGIIFHLCIYIFLMIYGFQIVFILMYGLFLPNQKLLDFAQGVKLIFGKKIYQQMQL